MTGSKVVVMTAVLALFGFAHDARAQSKTEIQAMDRDGDGVVTRTEWQGQAGAFRQHDTNRDGVLSGTEVWDAGDLRSRGRSRNNQRYDGLASEFIHLDRNNDGRITADEWPFDRAAFERADTNRDTRISRSEFFNDAMPANRQLGRFRDYDTNNDGVIAANEWRESHLMFLQLDRNRDGRITRDEFRDVAATIGTFERSGAYRAGYQRGQIEGRAAGREDRDVNRYWDLDGQRELESADSGYEARYGSRADYQAGYRDGFRVAYPEGWDHR